MASNLKLLWNPEKESALIDLVSEREALWNPVHVNYSKKTLRQALYEDINLQMIRRWPGDATLLTGGILHKKFNTLQSYFQREAKRIQQASGSAGLDLSSKWIHYQRMLFLKDTAFVGHSESNLDGSNQDPMGQNEESNLTVLDSQQEMEDEGINTLVSQPGTSFDPESSTNQEPNCTPTATPARYYEGEGPRKRQKVGNAGDDVIKTVASALKARSDQENSMHYQLGKMVENASRNLSSLRANDFMQRIFNVISEFSTMEHETFFK